MNNLWLMLALLAALSGSCLAAGEVKQDTKGECANAIAYIGGNVTIQCGLQKEALQPLVASLQDFEKRTKAGQQEMARMVEQTNRTLVALLQSLDKFQSTITQRDRTISERDSTITALSQSLAGQVKRSDNSVEFTQQIGDWRKRYEEVLAQWKMVRGEDEQSQRAYRLIAEGKLDEAAALLKRVMEVQEKQAVAPAAVTAFRAAQVADLRFHFDEAEGLYKRAHQLAPDDQGYLLDYTNFLWRQHRYAQAIRVNEEALESLPAQSSNTRQQAARAVILGNIAKLYSVTQRFAAAEKAYVAARDIQRGLVTVNPAAYDDDLATTLTNLGVLYRDTQRFAEAEKAYAEARDIERRLAATNPAAYEPDLADILNNLGSLYDDTQRQAEAEKAYVNARDIYRRLVATNPAIHEPNLASTLNNLGALYRDTQRFAQAEKALVEARNIWRRLATANPAAYEPNLARALNNLGALYRVTKRFAEAEKAYVGALDIRRRLAVANPATYEPGLALTLNNLGNFYFDTQRMAEAEKAYVEARDIRRRLAAANPAAYEPGLALTLNNLGVLYGDTRRLAEAEGQLVESTALWRKYAANNPGARIELRRALSNLQDVYTATGALDKRAGVQRELTALATP